MALDMDRHGFGVLDRPQLVHRLADHVHHASQRAAPTGTEIGPPWSMAFMPRTIPSVAFHGNTTHPSFAQVLLPSKITLTGGHGKTIANDFKRLVNRRHGALDKLHIDGRPEI